MLLNSEKGLGNLKVKTDEKALEHIARMSDGDAGRLFRLEIAVMTTSRIVTIQSI